MLKIPFALVALVASQISAQALTPAEVSKIDAIVTQNLAADGVPGAEVS